MKQLIFSLVACIVLSGCAGLDSHNGYTTDRNALAGYMLLQGISNTARMNANMYQQQYMIDQQRYNQQLQTNRILHQQQWQNDLYNNGWNR